MLKYKDEIAGNTDTGLLKWLALIFMIIDHVGVRFCGSMPEMRILGRIAFPLYCWCIVVGACHTRSIPRYALRLLIAAIISQPLYMLGMHHTWQNGNVFFTLLLGLLGIWGIRENKDGSRLWAPAAVLLMTSLYSTDYGWKGVLLMILLYLARERRGAVAAVMIAFCAFWGQGSAAITTLFGMNLTKMPIVKDLCALNFVAPFLRLQAMSLLALPLMLMKTKSRTPFPKWAAYAVYPVHLLILWIIQLAIGMLTLQNAAAVLFPFLS